ncbi:MAG: hypothetical protein LPK00_00005 [Bacillaceae bacterium]|nr:hypothetical protein [Bacillaceae bacterium]
MSKHKGRFLEQLEKELNNHPSKKDILKEYEAHYDFKLRDLILLGYGREKAEVIVLEQLGTPATIASQFHYKTMDKILLSNIAIFCNYLMFFIGILLTISHIYEFQYINLIWHSLVHTKWFVLSFYFILWIVLGYAIGRLYGFNGRNTLNTVLKIALIPNVVYGNLKVSHNNN